MNLRRGRGPVCCVVSGRRAAVASSRDIDCSEGGSDVSVVSPAPGGSVFFVPMAVISAATRRVGCSTPAVAFAAADWRMRVGTEAVARR